MEHEELINELWEVLSLEMSNADKIYNVREMIREWADEISYELPTAKEFPDSKEFHNNEDFDE